MEDGREVRDRAMLGRTPEVDQQAGRRARLDRPLRDGSFWQHVLVSRHEGGIGGYHGETSIGVSTQSPSLADREPPLALRIDDVDLQRDRRLVERFQEGDHTAFDTLYRRYFARLQRFCLKRVGDPHEAEEIAQEAFTRALRALPDLAGERRFYPWMTVIAGRLCVDHHRRRGRSEPTATVELGSVDGGQDAIVEQADFALLGRALERLAPRHREVLGFRE